MALTYDGTGGLFTRLGYIAGLAKKARNYQIALAPTSQTATTGIRTAYGAFAGGAAAYAYGTPFLRAIADENREADTVRPHLSRLRDAFRTTLIETVNANSATPIKTVQEAVIELAAQMTTDAETIESTTLTIGAASYGGGNVGTGAVVVSGEARKIIGERVTFSTKLTDFPHVRPETVRITCVKDARGSDVRPGSELFRIQGQRAYDNLDWRWPGGSGHDYVQACSSANVDGGRGPAQNILTHSDFDTFASNLPVGWTVTTGVAGTDITSTTTSLRGGTALKFVGDGSTTSGIRQQLGAQTGTVGRIKPDTLYMISFWIRSSAATPSAGDLTVRIYDGSSTVGSMSASIANGSLTTSYQHVVAKVMSPPNIPTTTYCQVYLTEAIENGKDYYIDELVIAEMPRPAKGAWGLCIVPGTTDWREGDVATVAISRATSGDWVLELDRFLGLYELGLSLPATASGGETIADSLIVDP